MREANQTSGCQSPRFRLVVFDMDDTLYPETDYVRSGYRAVCRHIAENTGLPDGPFFERMWWHFRYGDSRRVFDAVLLEFALGGRFTPAMLVEIYRLHMPEIHLSADAREVLTHLRTMSCRLAVVTDGPWGMQQRKVEALGLAGYVDQVVLTDSLPPGSAKPSPAAFAGLMHQFDIASAACVYVADNPLKDFLGPRQLGWFTMQILSEGGIYASKVAPPGGQPHVRIRDLREILRMQTTV